jgi:hypothetical protein
MLGIAVSSVNDDEIHFPESKPCADWVKKTKGARQVPAVGLASAP